ncbi:MAG: 5-formyltetrahydrofolate cyclo-ligase [Burkholderiales bacterium]|nr:5-formyltetrahydrofolate cyclo-ligase [Burkholderiales bacterium]
MDKAALRRELRKKRTALSPAARQSAEQQCARRAMRLLRRGQRVGMYLAAGSELSLQPLIAAALRRRIAVYLPVVPARGRKLLFCRLGDPRGAWQRNRFGIAEYRTPDSLPPRLLDLVFVPLVGFDAQGGRLGQGGGYYDTTFAARRLRRHWRHPRLIGAAFELQRVERIPREPHDAVLDGVVTEAALYRRRTR